MSRLKTVVEAYPNPKSSPLGPQKVKKYPCQRPKIKSKPNVRIEGNIENKSCAST